MEIDGYYLGCPSWGLKDWTGSLYSRKARPGGFLREYAGVFNSVEGNTTFYSLPTAELVGRWRDATPPSFRFSFKFPRTITHENRLENVDGEVKEFLGRMAPLGQRLGPFMVQLPPSFGPDGIDTLDYFLRSLPREFHYAVELRHRDFYEYEDSAQRVNDLIALRGAERIVMDTRAMRLGDPSHPDVQSARRRKPDLPVEPVALGPFPMVRLIFHPDDEVNGRWMETWRSILLRWMRRGRRPYVFVHCPDDVHSPRFARQLHALLAAAAEVGDMPPWPGETDEDGQAERAQLTLF